MVSGENMKRITLRLPDDLHDAINEMADRKNRSLNAQIVVALQYYLEENKHIKLANIDLKGMKDGEFSEPLKELLQGVGRRLWKLENKDKPEESDRVE